MFVKLKGDCHPWCPLPILGFFLHWLGWTGLSQLLRSNTAKFRDGPGNLLLLGGVRDWLTLPGDGGPLQ